VYKIIMSGGSWTRVEGTVYINVQEQTQAGNITVAT